MRFNRSYLKCLSFLSILFLGGCSWVANLDRPEALESKPTDPSQESVSESNNAQHHAASTPDSAIATPDSEMTASESTPASASGINHGERLSTLNDGLPPGRLPPDIVPATGDAQRLPQIEPGRSDPFASLPVRPFVVQQRPVTSSSIASTPIASTPIASAPTGSSSPSVSAGSTTQPSSEQSVVPPSPQAVVPVPIARQLLPPPLAQTPLAPVPTAPVAVAPSPATAPIASEPISVASAASTPPSFEFSGVVQMGDRVNIIVEEPSGSRYVQIGARVGNGQFVIKAVDFNQGPTPAVILERGGAESVHWVGSPIAM